MNVYKVIIDHLGRTQSEIVAAMAWFANRDITKVLYKKSRTEIRTGIKMTFALNADEVNQGPSGLNLYRIASV